MFLLVGRGVVTQNVVGLGSIGIRLVSIVIQLIVYLILIFLFDIEDRSGPCASIRTRGV